MSSLLALVGALGGLVVGGLVTYLTSRSQLRAEAELTYDKALRDLRLPHYQKLFHLTEALPRQWRGTPPTRSELHALRLTFHAWYFSEEASGMFLSQAAREAYLNLQNEMQSAVMELDHPDDAVADPRSPALRFKASTLRHQLSADLGVAEQARHRWTTPRSVAPPPAREGLS